MFVSAALHPTGVGARGRGKSAGSAVTVERRADSGQHTRVAADDDALLPAKPTTLAALLVGAAILTLAGRGATAQTGDEATEPEASVESKPLPLGWELSAGTRFPLEIGIEGVLEVPLGFTAHFGLGWMPRFYRDAINETAVGFGWYDDEDAALVRAALEDAFLISPSIGWRPPPIPGLEVYGGYVLAFLGGTVTRPEVEAIVDEDLPAAAGVAEVPLSGKGHGFQLGVAYQATLAPHVGLRMSLAYFQLFDSSAGIDLEVSGQAAQRVLERVETRLDEKLHDLLTTYVKAPLFGIAVVYVF
jgi:hypothetical protein